ncbi:MAG TPA: sulfite exporter TauE/SafE family protein [Xanthobacteraceae bacterium]|nr:sulfite exporter TauE/SafE family protein [Xanthobacteraceae bacterium]
MSALDAVQPAYAISGFLVGALVGLTGVGGGSLMTPLLILVFGINPAAAVGTDLLYAAVTKTAGSLVHGFNQTIDWRIVRRLAAGSIPMTIVTMAVLRLLDINSPAVRDLINAALTFALFATAVTLVFRDRLVARYSARLALLPPQRITGFTIIAGAALGLVVSISSIGAGAIGVTVLFLLYPKLPMARIVGSDIAHAVPLTLVGGIGHWLLGAVDLPVFASLIIGSVPGILLGSYAAVRTPERMLRLVLAGTLVVVATKLSFGLVSPSTDVVAAKTTTKH